MGVPPRLVGSPAPSHSTKMLEIWTPNDHMERSDLAKRFFIAGWERERAERAKRERERGAGA